MAMLVPLVLALCAAMASAAIVEHNFTVNFLHLFFLLMYHLQFSGIIQSHI